MNFSKKTNTRYNLITILGPTAGGKTSLAAHLAKELNSEIISADSRQVYKQMDLGTGKDIEDYTVDGINIKYHIVDIVEAGEKYNVFQYQKDFFSAFNKINKANKTPIMCGGTGLYIDAIVQNYELLEVPPNEDLRIELEKKSLDELTKMLTDEKKTHNVSDFDTKKRAIRAIEIEQFKKNNTQIRPNFPQINSINFGLKFDRKIQKERITQRLEERLNEGMIEEVEGLIKNGVPTETLVYYGLEYKFVTNYILGIINKTELFNKLNIAIHQFSKRQMTWFRRMEKKGVEIFWINGIETKEEKIEKILNVITKKIQT